LSDLSLKFLSNSMEYPASAKSEFPRFFREFFFMILWRNVCNLCLNSHGVQGLSNSFDSVDAVSTIFFYKLWNYFESQSWESFLLFFGVFWLQLKQAWAKKEGSRAINILK
jgi:hypothetical protein